ncbi:hypothetical protein RDE2_30530 [Rhodococcus sp. RDE2]|nr:hypothetical protein RDE2_30530 [Rhodococcus sp. RDE2]
MVSVCPNRACLYGQPVGRRGAVLSGRTPVLDVRTKEQAMSYILYDALLPWLGPDAASYWAHLLVIDPI